MGEAEENILHLNSGLSWTLYDVDEKSLNENLNGNKYIHDLRQL